MVDLLISVAWKWDQQLLTPVNEDTFSKGSEFVSVKKMEHGLGKSHDVVVSIILNSISIVGLTKNYFKRSDL